MKNLSVKNILSQLRFSGLVALLALSTAIPMKEACAYETTTYYSGFDEDMAGYPSSCSGNANQENQNFASCTAIRNAINKIYITEDPEDVVYILIDYIGNSYLYPADAARIIRHTKNLGAEQAAAKYVTRRLYNRRGYNLLFRGAFFQSTDDLIREEIYNVPYYRGFDEDIAGHPSSCSENVNQDSNSLASCAAIQKAINRVTDNESTNDVTNALIDYIGNARIYAADAARIIRHTRDEYTEQAAARFLTQRLRDRENFELLFRGAYYQSTDDVIRNTHRQNF